MVAGRMPVEITIHPEVSAIIAALPHFVLVRLLVVKRLVAIVVLRIPDYFVIIVRTLHPVPIFIIVTMCLAVVVTAVFVVAIFSFEMHYLDFDDFNDLDDHDLVVALIEVLEVATIIPVAVADIVPAIVIMGKSGFASHGGSGPYQERCASKFVD
jgi:hypothetical protein